MTVQFWCVVSLAISVVYLYSPSPYSSISITFTADCLYKTIKHSQSDDACSIIWEVQCLTLSSVCGQSHEPLRKEVAVFLCPQVKAEQYEESHAVLLRPFDRQ